MKPGGLRTRLMEPLVTRAVLAHLENKGNSSLETQQNTVDVCANAAEVTEAIGARDPGVRRVQPKRANTKRNFLNMTHDDMRADHNPRCRQRLSASWPSSAAAVTILDPKKDGVIRKFVKLLNN